MPRVCHSRTHLNPRQTGTAGHSLITSEVCKSQGWSRKEGLPNLCPPVLPSTAAGLLRTQGVEGWQGLRRALQAWVPEASSEEAGTGEMVAQEEVGEPTSGLSPA